jgi:hypothetical protein
VMRRIRSGRGGVRCVGVRPAPADLSGFVGITSRRAVGSLGATDGSALLGDVLAIARAHDLRGCERQPHCFRAATRGHDRLWDRAPTGAGRTR